MEESLHVTQESFTVATARAAAHLQAHADAEAAAHARESFASETLKKFSNEIAKHKTVLNLGDDSDDGGEIEIEIVSPSMSNKVDKKFVFRDPVKSPVLDLADEEDSWQQTQTHSPGFHPEATNTDAMTKIAMAPRDNMISNYNLYNDKVLSPRGIGASAMTIASSAATDDTFTAETTLMMDGAPLSISKLKAQSEEQARKAALADERKKREMLQKQKQKVEM